MTDVLRIIKPLPSTSYTARWFALSINSPTLSVSKPPEQISDPAFQIRPTRRIDNALRVCLTPFQTTLSCTFQPVCPSQASTKADRLLVFSFFSPQMSPNHY